jgi:tRNA(Ile)-lysidine synthase
VQNGLTPGAIRFKTTVERLGAGNGRLLIAVSGGPDSLAMLLLAHEAIPGRIVAATVDHGLRAESAGEAAFVAGLCADRSIAHHILHPDQPITGNIQSSARAARYRLLERAADEEGCHFIATAHHRDDQLETLLMRLARGSGLDGLSGIRQLYGRVIRPVLDFSKAELEQICAQAGIVPVRDPSNDDAQFERVAMRQFLAANAALFDPERMARSAGALAEAGEALDWATTKLLAERMTRDGDAVTLHPQDLPRDLQRRLMIAALRQLVPDIAPRGEAALRLLATLQSGNKGMIGDILCKGGEVWTFSPAPQRRLP